MYAKEQLIKYEYFADVLAEHRISDVLEPLTGLITRTHMCLFIKDLIDRNIPFTYGMIDLDNFKYINDTYGHSAGDKVLAEIADDLKDFLEGYGLAGRYGGDEFLFVNLRDIEYSEKKEFCNKLFNFHIVLRKNHKLGDQEEFVTGTAGLATYPLDTDNYTEMFAMIDKTLYRGKSKGRNCYIIYVPEKHKDIEIITLKKNRLYQTLRNLANDFDESNVFHAKIEAGYESLKNDLHLTNMYYISAEREMRSIVDNHSFGSVNDIDLLMTEESFSTNEITKFRETSPQLFRVLQENEIESILIMEIRIEAQKFGYLMCAEPHTQRIWQEDELAIIFLFARMLGEYLMRNNIRLP